MRVELIDSVFHEGNLADANKVFAACLKAPNKLDLEKLIFELDTEKGFLRKVGKLHCIFHTDHFSLSEACYGRPIFDHEEPVFLRHHAILRVKYHYATGFQEPGNEFEPFL